MVDWLNFHRDALAAKCEGLSDDQLIAQSAEPSQMTLLGLVRHLTEMEHYYLVWALGGGDAGVVYCTDEQPDADFLELDAAMVTPSMQRWQQQRDAADRIIAKIDDMSAPVAVGSHNARWLLLKVIQEYARHNGHADIVRERIDGAIGE
jgi:hypothetical protein